MERERNTPKSMHVHPVRPPMQHQRHRRLIRNPSAEQNKTRTADKNALESILVARLIQTDIPAVEPGPDVHELASEGVGALT